MPTLDSCIGSQFDAGSFETSTGVAVVIPVATTLLNPETYDPDAVTYSLDFSKFYNSGYFVLLIGW